MNGYIKRSEYHKLKTDFDKIKLENNHNMKLTEAWKQQVGRFQMQCKDSDLELDKLNQLKTKFKEQLDLMKLQAKSLQAQLDHERNRAELLLTQLESNQLQLNDSDFDVKTENCHLQKMVVQYHDQKR